MATKRIDERELTAYHEAGHAVVSFLQKVRIIKVSILPEERDAILGYLITSDKLGVQEGEQNFRAKYNDRLESMVMIAMAGVTAEYILTGSKNWQYAAQDLANVNFILSHLTHSQREYELYDDLLWVRTETLLREPANWKMLQALAQYMLNVEPTVSGKKAWQLFREVNQEMVRASVQNIQKSLGS